jgi:hypothetical protein
MPKRLSEYNLNDHLRLRPLLHLLKTTHYRRVDSRYCRVPPRSGDEAAVRRQIAGNRTLVTIAFNDPDAVGWQVRLIRELVVRDRHLIADNSSDDASAVENARIARDGECLYLRLPPNPWTARNPSRSHGLAMNWVWQRILKPAAPAAFGFLDADIFPTAACDPFAPLAEHPFCGDKRWAGQRWFLWAGYCFFRFAAVAEKPLDFGLDWFVGLDTGGANWDVLYRHADPRTVPERPISEVAALPDVPWREAYFERRGDWLHEVGLAGNPAIRGRKRDALRSILAPLLDAAVPGKSAT